MCTAQGRELRGAAAPLHLQQPIRRTVGLGAIVGLACLLGPDSRGAPSFTSTGGTCCRNRGTAGSCEQLVDDLLSRVWDIGRSALHDSPPVVDRALLHKKCDARLQCHAHRHRPTNERSKQKQATTTNDQRTKEMPKSCARMLDCSPRTRRRRAPEARATARPTVMAHGYGYGYAHGYGLWVMWVIGYLSTFEKICCREE